MARPVECFPTLQPFLTSISTSCPEHGHSSRSTSVRAIARSALSIYFDLLCAMSLLEARLKRCSANLHSSFAWTLLALMSGAM
ncbi:hypothetical protein AUEXF2481DRAFT_366771 [Aureobasidium subglaciale EXF-2481]|uniref:Uncharacterized protein n=1 Tax=Aureobasidium subglaciale (strain EXF-2481) TaxID=1043005 RepID=A0A074YAC9_AURSE|nr:uncharacterized protein AUEXF2481DRAFT_366771 [Aureobasidium subglaciale EXF-2481]KEQ92939.1 hypothetical protein AUEXF2481DRAFT_366771 [Aureobasidium subglaciale EXF-2481]